MFIRGLNKKDYMFYRIYYFNKYLLRTI